MTISRAVSDCSADAVNTKIAPDNLSGSCRVLQKVYIPRIDRACRFLYNDGVEICSTHN